MRILSANAPYGAGGLGLHFQQLVEETRAAGQLQYYLAPRTAPDDSRGRTLTASWWEPIVLSYTPVRWSNSWKCYLSNEFFDRRTAALLPTLMEGSQVDRVMGFAGGALRTFHQAKDHNGALCELVSPTSHIANVRRLQSRVPGDTGIQDTWLNEALYQKTLREYEVADRIYVHSAYTRQSFLDAGFAPDRLVDTVLEIAPRFQPPAHRPPSDRFRIAYVGRVDATKGIPLLLEAYDRLSFPAELTIVGGWSTRAMRKYIEPKLANRPHVHLTPGDPLPTLHQADVFVHPSYEDGFGYAPMEALACGVPVIVTDHTGMQEYVQEGRNGFVVPIGSVDAIVEALEAVHQSPLATTESLLPASFPHPVPSSAN